MEEQTVPSAGFSPIQTDSYESPYIPPPKYQEYTPTLASMDDPVSYGNLADTFDLSLLGDCYDDQDMATVPSPGAWMQSTSSLEPTYWQQMSLYAASPVGSDCYHSFSPSTDCKPELQLSGDSSPIHSPGSYGRQIANRLCHSPASVVAETERNLLLRQCLEDTTFQKKLNYKPIEIPSSSFLDDNDAMLLRDLGGLSNTSSTPEGVGSNLELNQIEPVFSLAFEQIGTDIQNTCNLLAISPDPMQWSSSDVQRWLSHHLPSFPRMMSMSGGTDNIRGLNGIFEQYWNINGRALCSFNEEEFRRRDPVNGDSIFAQLELWKMIQSKHQSVGQNYDLEKLLMCSPASSPVSIDSSSAPLNELLVPQLMLSEEGNKPCLSSDSSDTSSTSFPSPMGTEQISEDEDDGEETVEEKPIKSAGNSKPNNAKGSSSKSGSHIHLWQFLVSLLSSPQQHGSCIRWIDRSAGIFKIEDSVRVARLWGLRKNRPAMNYDKLSRSIRQYYRKGIMRKTERSQRLVYQFVHPYGL